MSLVEVKIEKKIATLYLNRADKLNALSKDLVEELINKTQKIIESVKNQECAVLLIKSKSNKAFCAGADLKERMGLSEGGVKDALNDLRRLMDSLVSVPVPTIAVVNGVAFGGGFELSLCCDLRVASPGAKVGLTETKLAIIPGAGGTQRLSRLVGVAKAKELIYLAKSIDAHEAEKLGIFNYVGDDAEKVAQKWASDIAASAPLAIRAAKKAIDGGMELSINEALGFERKCYEEGVLKSKDRVEALKAFVEKRVAVFKGE